MRPAIEAGRRAPNACRASALGLYDAKVGVWLSLVEHLVRDEGVVGSNPITPTTRFTRHSDRRLHRQPRSGLAPLPAFSRRNATLRIEIEEDIFPAFRGEPVAQRDRLEIVLARMAEEYSRPAPDPRLVKPIVNRRTAFGNRQRRCGRSRVERFSRCDKSSSPGRLVFRNRRGSAARAQSAMDGTTRLSGEADPSKMFPRCQVRS